MTAIFTMHKLKFRLWYKINRFVAFST